MKTKRTKVSATSESPVDVTIVVTQFKDVLAASPQDDCRGTGYTMKLAKNDPRAYVKGEDLFVRPPGAVIRFTLGAASRDRNRYYPVGISFVRERTPRGADELRLGFLNFPQGATRMDERTLTITDTYKDPARLVRYKFSLLVQRGADGKLGIIDPGIVHDGEA